MVLTKNAVFWSMFTDSHTEIIAEHKLHEDGVRGPNAVKVEITPPDGRIDVGALDTWVYRVDQDVLPEWYDPADAEARVRTVLRDALIGLTTLDARYSKITDVSALVNLTTLYARWSKVKDIAALRKRGCTIY